MPVLTHTAAETRPARHAACDVCPHSVDSHDAIGRRFCQATLDRALTRGCACGAVAT
jgi:hypothetical protein